MLNLHALPRTQQILLGLGAVAVGTLLVLAIAQFSSQVGTNVTGPLMDEALEGTGSGNGEGDPSLGLSPVGPLPAEGVPEGSGEGEIGSAAPGTGTPIRTVPAVVRPAPPLTRLGASHIAYIRGTPNAEVRYATNRSGSWVTETAANDPRDSYERASMALGPGGSVHIAYVGRDSNVRYATNRGGSWTSTIVSGGSLPSLAIDQNGYAHVAYTRSQLPESIQYATNRSGSWVTQTVATVSSPGTTSIALDARGAAHVSYTFGPGTFGRKNLSYATNASGSWQSTAQETGEYVNFHDIEVDGQGFAHIAYSFFRTAFPRTAEVRYATNRSGAWNREAVATGINSEFGSGTTFALGSDGKAHIAFVDDYATGGYRVLYATNRSGAWVIQPAAPPQEDYNIGLSLDVDQRGYTYVSFFENRRLVRHATNASGGWVLETVRSDPEGSYTSIRVR